MISKISQLIEGTGYRPQELIREGTMLSSLWKEQSPILAHGSAPAASMVQTQLALLEIKPGKGEGIDTSTSGGEFLHCFPGTVECTTHSQLVSL